MAKITNWNPPKIDTKTAYYEWNCDYAIFAHEGATLTNGTKMPARPWTDVAIADLNLPAIYKAHYQVVGDCQLAWERTVEQLSDRFKFTIEDERWQWNRTTLRRNKSVVSSPRNIVDLGTLRDSQSVELR